MRFFTQAAVAVAAFSSAVVASADPGPELPGLEIRQASQTTPVSVPTGTNSPDCPYNGQGFNPTAFERRYLRDAGELLAALANILQVDPEILNGGYLNGIFIQLVRTVITIDGLLTLAEALQDDAAVSASGNITPRRIRGRADHLKCNSNAAAKPNAGPDGNPMPAPRNEPLEPLPSINSIFMELGVPAPPAGMLKTAESGNPDSKIPKRDAIPVPATEAVEMEKRDDEKMEEKKSDASSASAVSFFAILFAAVALV